MFSLVVTEYSRAAGEWTVNSEGVINEDSVIWSKTPGQGDK